MLIGISGYIGSGKDTLGAMIQYQMYLERFRNKHSFNFDTIDALPWTEFLKIPVGSMANTGIRSLSGISIQKFGHALKQIVCTLTGCTLSQLEDQEFKKKELPSMWNRSFEEAKEWIRLKYPSAAVNAGDYEFAVAAKNYGFKYERTYREMMQEIGTEVMRNHFIDNIWINALMSKYSTDRLAIDAEGYEHRIYPNWIITDVRFPNEAKAIKEAGGLLIRIDGLPRVSDHPSEISLDNYQEFDVRIQNYFSSAVGMTKESSLELLMEDAAYIVNHFKLVEYAGTNIKPSPDSKPGNSTNPQ